MAVWFAIRELLLGHGVDEPCAVRLQLHMVCVALRDLLVAAVLIGNADQLRGDNGSGVAAGFLAAYCNRNDVLLDALLVQLADKRLLLLVSRTAVQQRRCNIGKVPALMASFRP